MGNVDPGNCGTLLFDRLDEIGPEQREVMSVGLLKFGFFVNLGFTIITRVERPTVPPANMEDAIRAVEISADGVFLRSVSTKLSMFPDAGEFFKFVGCDLMIRGIRSLLFVVEDRRTGDLTPTGAMDAFGI